MSEENEEDNDTFAEEFEFYFSFTKPLVLELPTEEDRALAAAWVQKLEAEPETRAEKEQRLNYLKLLQFVLQRGRLGGIFSRQPPSGSLQPFPQGFSVIDMGKLMLEQDDDIIYGSGDASRVPYCMELSNDLREYVASQEVPDFGVQMYYAWSSEEPVYKWSSFDEEKFPLYILEKIKQMKASKFDEKSQLKANMCGSEKKDGSLIIPELSLMKKVKSPDEIEKTQGRSFLTYMGLVGRMGNLSEKCDEDPERQNPPRKSCPKKKKCPGNAGVEDTREEEFDILVSGLGGELNSMNRPCLCPNLAHQTNRGGQQLKKRPQSACIENQPINVDCENIQWGPPTVAPPGTGRTSRMRDQCFGGNMGPMISPQRNESSRNSAMNRRVMECPSEGNLGGFPNQNGVCVCTSPPCTCPCPRAPAPQPMKTPSPEAGGRVCQNPTRTFTRPVRQEGADCNVNRSRGLGTRLTSFTAPPCTPAQVRPDVTPTGGRTGQASESLRPVLHCYDNQNPDPTLTKTIAKTDNWIALEGGGAKYMDTDYKIMNARDQLIADAMENKCKLASRRGLFESQPQPGPSGLNRMPSPPCGSSPLASHPLCEYSPPCEEEAYPQQQLPQNYMDYQGGVPQMYPTCGDRINTNTQKRPQPQGPCRTKNTPATGAFTINKNAGRLANMTNVLQGMKQMTEAHREKCPEPGSSRAPPNAAYCDGVQGQTTVKPRTRGEGVVGGPMDQMGRNMMGCGGYQAPPSTPQPGYSNYPSRGFGNYPGLPSARGMPSPVLPDDAYEFTLYKTPVYRQGSPCYDDEDFEEECDDNESSESAEAVCPKKSLLEKSNFQLSERCKEALNRRPQDYYKLTCWEENEFESQESRRDNNFLQKDSPYPGLPSTPVEFRTMLSEHNTTYDQAQWVSARGRLQTSRDLNNVTINTNEATVGSVRTTPGRVSQIDSTLTGPPGDAGQFDENCANNPQIARANRYFDQSVAAHAQPGYSRSAQQPSCSTPLRHHRETFKDRGADDLSSIHR